MTATLTTVAWVPAILAAALLAAAAVNLWGPPPVREEFARLGYPAWLRPTVALLEVLAALMLLWPAGRGAGALLAAFLLLGVLVSVARQRDPLRLHYPAVLLALAGVTWFGRG